jgi:4-amino-4-deoxy-L-arabinose transferase-like glycosyltransferase
VIIKNISVDRRLIIFSILLIGTIPRILNIVWESTIELDGIIYAKMAGEISRGEFGAALKEVFPPVYPAFIGLFHLFISDIELAGRLVSFFAGLLVMFLFLLFFKGITSEKKALVGSFLIAIHPFLIRSSAAVLSESLATVLFVCTIILFYKGLTEDDTLGIVFSGFLLSLTYLTRPEYLVYCIPLLLLLLIQKRFYQALIFIICFSLLTVSYMYYLKIETGILVVSKKAILAKNKPDTGSQYYSYLLPFLPMGKVIKHIPFVFYNFLMAVTIPFVILSVAGFRRVERNYRVLFASLLLFHVMSIATMSKSSQRFSIEFVPLTIPFAVTGMYVIKDFLERFRHKEFFFKALIFVFIGICLLHGLVFSDEKRVLHKRAGLYLASVKPGSIVLSRLPIVSFYGKGEWINIKKVSGRNVDCDGLISEMKNKKVEYVAVDEKTEREYPSTKRCTDSFTLLNEFSDKNVKGFLKLYKVNFD